MMKLKSNQTRTYDGDGYKKRAACLCFRSESEEEVQLSVAGKVGVSPQSLFLSAKHEKNAQNEMLVGWWKCLVLLVSSSRHPDRWIVPGGGMEPEEEPNVAAVREVCEECSQTDRRARCPLPAQPWYRYKALSLFCIESGCGLSQTLRRCEAALMFGSLGLFSRRFLCLSCARGGGHHCL
ncbi:diphosphoinositol polyphosphate phosphohydrolase 1 isoform X2 [Calonectris borealis]|uniref:diphosphoinositol polyphosphate phosphohydrolase 1 isoform X2 n=1 Tax=Calonectris borealis TaxID=1323832 RepID=UPI003F4C9E2B